MNHILMLGDQFGDGCYIRGTMGETIFYLIQNNILFWTIRCILSIIKNNVMKWKFLLTKENSFNFQKSWIGRQNILNTSVGVRIMNYFIINWVYRRQWLTKARTRKFGIKKSSEYLIVYSTDVRKCVVWALLMKFYFRLLM